MSKSITYKKVAIVHEFLLKMGGAERVVKSMLKAFPDADIYTLVYDEELTHANFRGTKIVGSGLQKWPQFIRNKYRLFFPYFRRAVEYWDFSEYDLVISSSSAFTHGVVTNLNTKHVCYYHSPTRYLWDWHANYLKEMTIGSLPKLVLSYLLSAQRTWDFLAAQRPDLVLANSAHVQKRISKFYRRESAVLYPPVDVQRFKVTETDKGYYLYVGALSPYKNVELAVRFFNKIGHPFKIIGDGKQAPFLKSIAKDNIEFLGNLSDQEVEDYLQNCKALIFPGEEDFGIAPVEAMACGKPVFAYKRGGAAKTVKQGETGWFFKENNLYNFEQEFAEFLRNFDQFKPKTIRKWAEGFSEEKFLAHLYDTLS